MLTCLWITIKKIPGKFEIIPAKRMYMPTRRIYMNNTFNEVGETNKNSSIIRKLYNGWTEVSPEGSTIVHSPNRAKAVELMNQKIDKINSVQKLQIPRATHNASTDRVQYPVFGLKKLFSTGGAVGTTWAISNNN